MIVLSRLVDSPGTVVSVSGSTADPNPGSAVD